MISGFYIHSLCRFQIGWEIYKFNCPNYNHYCVCQNVQIVKQSTKVRVLGSGHSFNASAACDEDMVILDCLANTMPPILDATARTIQVPGSWTYGALVAFLKEKPWAVHNLASLPHISIGASTMPDLPQYVRTH